MFTAEQIQRLNELELEVYNYIMKNNSRILEMKIRELAEETHVSTTTILRFCKKMGCNGYSEFKVKYKMSLNESPSQFQESDVRLLLDYFHKIDRPEFNDKLQDVASLIYYANKVIFVGIGTSGILAKYGARFFSNIGKFSQYIDDPFYPVPSGYYDGSVVIALSVSGETEQTIQQINRFKGFNCALVSLTNSETSTIAKMSDISLSYYMPMDVLPLSINITTQVPVIYILETIGRKLHMMLQDAEVTCLND